MHVSDYITKMTEVAPNINDVLLVSFCVPKVVVNATNARPVCIVWKDRDEAQDLPLGSLLSVPPEGPGLGGPLSPG